MLISPKEREFTGKENILNFSAMKKFTSSCAWGLGDTAQNQAYVPEKLGKAKSLFFLSVLWKMIKKKKNY